MSENIFANLNKPEDSCGSILICPHFLFSTWNSSLVIICCYLGTQKLLVPFFFYRMISRCLCLLLITCPCVTVMYLLCISPLCVGVLADVMHYVRNHYHSLVRRNSAVKLSLGVALTTNQSRDYWTEVRKNNNAKNNMSSVINGLSCSNSIANLFATHYEQLYNSVPSDKETMHNIYDNILLDVNKCCVNMNDDTDKCDSINVDDVYSVIRSFSVNKDDSVDDLYYENFKQNNNIYLKSNIQCT